MAAPPGHMASASGPLSVFVNIGKPLPPTLVWSLLDSLQLPGVTPRAYHGVPPPVGQTVSSTYIEARNELLTSDVVVLVLATDSYGHVSDDWSLSFIRNVKERGAGTHAYLVLSAERSIQWLSWSEFQPHATTVTSLASAEDVVSVVSNDIATLVRQSGTDDRRTR